MLRLAFHDAATYDATAGDGGANASLRLELERPENRGLKRGWRVIEAAMAGGPRSRTPHIPVPAFSKVDDCKQLHRMSRCLQLAGRCSRDYLAVKHPSTAFMMMPYKTCRYRGYRGSRAGVVGRHDTAGGCARRPCDRRSSHQRPSRPERRRVPGSDVRSWCIWGCTFWKRTALYVSSNCVALV